MKALCVLSIYLLDIVYICLWAPFRKLASDAAANDRLYHSFEFTITLRGQGRTISPVAGDFDVCQDEQ